jgi:hypothetical protein
MVTGEAEEEEPEVLNPGKNTKPGGRGGKLKGKAEDNLKNVSVIRRNTFYGRIGIQPHGVPTDDCEAIQRPDVGVTNQMNIYEGSTAVVEHKYKDQATRLEIAKSFIICSHQAYKMHIESIAIFTHNDDRVEVARGWFTDKSSNIDLTCLESVMSFLQVKLSVTIKEKLRQVRSTICVNRREIAHIWLEAVAGADNPYSLIVFLREDIAQSRLVKPPWR